MDLNSKLTITVVIVFSYSFLKFAFPLMIDILNSVLKSINPNDVEKNPKFEDVIKRVPDILGLFLLIVVILIWTNNIN